MRAKSAVSVAVVLMHTQQIFS